MWYFGDRKKKREANIKNTHKPVQRRQFMSCRFLYCSAVPAVQQERDISNNQTHWCAPRFNTLRKANIFSEEAFPFCLLMSYSVRKKNHAYSNQHRGFSGRVWDCAEVDLDRKVRRAFSLNYPCCPRQNMILLEDCATLYSFQGIASYFSIECPYINILPRLTWIPNY